MNCPRHPQVHCVGDSCPGRRNPAGCDHAATLAAHDRGDGGPARADLELAMRAELCEHASGPCGCGSGPPRLCSRPDRPDEVRRADCLRCAAGDW